MYLNIFLIKEITLFLAKQGVLILTKFFYVVLRNIIHFGEVMSAISPMQSMVSLNNKSHTNETGVETFLTPGAIASFQKEKDNYTKIQATSTEYESIIKRLRFKDTETVEKPKLFKSREFIRKCAPDIIIYNAETWNAIKEFTDLWSKELSRVQTQINKELIEKLEKVKSFIVNAQVKLDQAKSHEDIEAIKEAESEYKKATNQKQDILKKQRYNLDISKDNMELFNRTRYTSGDLENTFNYEILRANTIVCVGHNNSEEKFLDIEILYLSNVSQALMQNERNSVDTIKNLKKLHKAYSTFVSDTTSCNIFGASFIKDEGSVRVLAKKVSSEAKLKKTEVSESTSKEAAIKNNKQGKRNADWDSYGRSGKRPMCGRMTMLGGSSSHKREFMKVKRDDSVFTGIFRSGLGIKLILDQGSPESIKNCIKYIASIIDKYKVHTKEELKDYLQKSDLKNLEKIVIDNAIRLIMGKFNKKKEVNMDFLESRKEVVKNFIELYRVIAPELFYPQLARSESLDPSGEMSINGSLEDTLLVQQKNRKMLEESKLDFKGLEYITLEDFEELADITREEFEDYKTAREILGSSNLDKLLESLGEEPLSEKDPNHLQRIAITRGACLEFHQDDHENEVITFFWPGNKKREIVGGSVNGLLDKTKTKADYNRSESSSPLKSGHNWRFNIGHFLLQLDGEDPRSSMVIFNGALNHGTPATGSHVEQLKEPDSTNYLKRSIHEVQQLVGDLHTVGHGGTGMALIHSKKDLEKYDRAKKEAKLTDHSKTCSEYFETYFDAYLKFKDQKKYKGDSLRCKTGKKSNSGQGDMYRAIESCISRSKQREEQEGYENLLDEMEI